MDKEEDKTTEEYAVLSNRKWIMKIFSFLKFVYLDKQEKRRKRKAGIVEFEEYGLTCFVGRQGDGKTISMLEMAEYYRLKFPGIRFASNFGYVHEDFPITNWSDITEHDFKSEPVGIVFLLDEIHAEFSSRDSKNFPERALRILTQQRKNKIKILSTAQVFTRIAKPIREQTYEVVECRTLLGRWTFQQAYDAYFYDQVLSQPHLKHKVPKIWKRNFVQNDLIRNLFDSYAMIDALGKEGLLLKEKGDL